MAYNYEYPYTDPYRYNADALYNTVKKLDAAPKIYIADPVTAPPTDAPVGSLIMYYSDITHESLANVYVVCHGELNYAEIYSA